MCIAKGRCTAALDRVSKLCSKNSTYYESNQYIPLVDNYVLATEFPELQDDSEDAYTPREDDLASIGNDDGGRFSSGSDAMMMTLIVTGLQLCPTETATSSL